MAKIGEYRLKIYELLYEKPLCDYSEKVGTKDTQNVLILGNGWAGNEAFKASFWAGQTLDKELNITVASQNALQYQEKMLSNEKGALFPALKLYAEQKQYANLRFIDINVTKGVDASGFIPLDFEHNQYNYIIVTLGSAETNWLAASELITQIGAAREKGVTYTGKTIINVFDEFSDQIEREDQITLEDYGADNEIEVHFFGKGGVASGELNRVARNINFSYEMKYDQRISKKIADERFEVSQNTEFIKTPQDYEIGNLDLISNFIGSDYNADSSFAAAVHIPVKLSVCKDFDSEKAPIDTLKESIRKKNNLYWKLVTLEHRRWNAYTVMRGYRAPNEQEELTFLYHNGNNHQDKQRLLHICLCDCGEKATLEKFDQQYQLWIKNKCPKAFPSELDRASLRVHQLVSQLSKDVDIVRVLGDISGDNPEYVNLRKSIIKLVNDEENSVTLYHKTLRSAIAYAQLISSEERKKLEQMDIMLSPIKIRNTRMDFFGLDAQLVEMIPFALWYEDKYRTIITISDGMSTTTHDVIIPTLFCAENAIFIGKTVGSKRYQKIIKNYFESRGSNTTPQFVTIAAMDIERISACLEKQICDYGAHNLIINCVPNRTYDALLAVGKLMEKYPGEIMPVQYLPGKGIVSFSEDKNIGVGLENKSYSLSEFIQLMGGKVSNEYANLYDSTQYESLLELFRTFSETKTLKGTTGTGKEFNPWVQMTGLLANIAKDNSIEDILNLKEESTPLHYNGKFSETVYRNSRIGKTMKKLQEYHIIRDYDERVNGANITVAFDYVNPEIKFLLSTFEDSQIEDQDLFREIKFSPLSGLKLSNRLIKDAQLFVQEEPQEQIAIKKNFMQELLRRRYIEDLIIDTDGRMSFLFKDEATMYLLKTQGVVFELIIYYLMRESGMFDDVETGVKIAWDAEDISPDEILLNELNSMGSDVFGYRVYKKKRQEILGRPSIRQAQSVKNEIDVIGISGMNTIMVSCKTSTKDNMQWIYEIKSIADHFLSTGVLAVSSDYSTNSRGVFKERAKQMKISLWGTETVWDTEKFRDALKEVVK